MKGALDWVVAYSIAILGGLFVVRAFLGVGIFVYGIPTAILAGVGAIRITKYKQRIPRPVSFYFGGWVLFIGWLLLSTLWKIRGIGSQQEFILLIVMLGVGLAVLLSLSWRAVQRLVPALYVIGFSVAVFVLVRYAQAGSLRGYGNVLGDQYLVVARILGLGTVAASLRLLTSEKRPMYLWIIALTTLVALAMSLARGALLSTLGILLLVGLFLSIRMETRRENIWVWLWSRMKKVALGAGVFVLIGGLVAVALQVERTARRLRRMFYGNELGAGGRGALWFTSLENITQAPILGYGLGSSGVMAGAYEGYYPHNLLLQAWLDGGVVAFLLLFSLVLFPFLFSFWHLFAGRLQSNSWIPSLGLFLFLVLEYSKSINFYSGRLLLVMSIVAVWGVCSAVEESGISLTEAKASS
jgi:O-antigen ligase